MLMDDGVNDYEECLKACEELGAEGFFDEVRKRYGWSKPANSPAVVNPSENKDVVQPLLK
jgi:hypothetical protein